MSVTWLVAVSTFVAAGVEWVEALTIVLAVGIYRSWRSALFGVAAAVLTLALLVGALGAALTASVPLGAVRTVVGMLLLLFGLKWLQKAVLRSAGLRPERDEALAFEAARAGLGSGATGFDAAAFATAYSGVFLEGLEVVFIVLALGGLDSLPAAVLGAAAALAVVVTAGVALRAPLTRVPENAIKYAVGVMLCSFGTFFAGEGAGVAWWRGDLSILLLVGAYALVSVLVVQVLRNPRLLPARYPAWLRAVRSGAREVWGLWVDDGLLAMVPVAALLGAALLGGRDGFGGIAAWVLFGGVVVGLLVGLRGPLRELVKRRTLEGTAPRSKTGS
jgi:uncharacterized membrane protein